MKTKLPTEITTKAEAEALLTELNNNGEVYHPEDDADTIYDINQNKLFTHEEAKQLNKLMNDIYIKELMDPCEYYNSL